MPKALIYCRVSSDRQVKEGHGLDGQELRCRRYAEVHGYEVAAVFRDEGVSGGLIEREGMQHMLAFLDAEGDGQETIVLIDDIKRLARDLMGHFTLRKAIQSRRARLESPSHKFGDGPEDVFVESILAATAELERNQNRRQVRNRMQARLEAGYWPFYPPPGYRFEKVPGHGKLIVPTEPVAGIIREAMEGFAAAQFQCQADVQRFLQSKGFKARRDRGKGVTYREQVKRLLTQEVYAGYISYPPWNVSRRIGHHQPLVTPETFARVQERLKDTGKLPQRKDLRFDFPLRGFVLCRGCKKPYTAAWSRGKRKQFPYYRCITSGCDFCHKSVSATVLHGDFEVLLGTLTARPDVLKAVRAEFLDAWNKRLLDVETMRKERRRELAGVQKQIDSYVEAVGQCHSPTVLKKIEQEIEALEVKKERLAGRIEQTPSYDFEHALDQVIEFLKRPDSVWRTGDLARRRTVLRMVFEQAPVYDRETGFGTPRFSLPVDVTRVCGHRKKPMVDLVRKSWNTLEASIRQWGELLGGLSQDNQPPPTAWSTRNSGTEC